MVEEKKDEYVRRVVSFFVRDLSHEKTGVPREASRNRLRHNFPCTDLYWFPPPLPPMPMEF